MQHSIVAFIRLFPLHFKKVFLFLPYFEFRGSILPGLCVRMKVSLSLFILFMGNLICFLVSAIIYVLMTHKACSNFSLSYTSYLCHLPINSSVLTQGHLKGNTSQVELNAQFPTPLSKAVLPLPHPPSGLVQESLSHPFLLLSPLLTTPNHSLRFCCCWFFFNF